MACGKGGKKGGAKKGGKKGGKGKGKPCCQHIIIMTVLKARGSNVLLYKQ